MLAVPPPTFWASIDPDVVRRISPRMNGIGSSSRCTPRSAVGSLKDSLRTSTTLTRSRTPGSRVRSTARASAAYRAATRRIVALL